jgi:hypothetical protein
MAEVKEAHCRRSKMGQWMAIGEAGRAFGWGIARME